MKIYQTKTNRWGGTSYAEVAKKAHHLTHTIEKRSKRRPYIRSIYFGKEKIFIDHFWPHISQKTPRDRLRRLLYLPCAVELLEKSRYAPTVRPNPNNSAEILHRFAGSTPGGELFYVQVTENTQKKQKYFISVFPPD